jgi:hypothetical protein
MTIPGMMFAKAAKADAAPRIRRSQPNVWWMAFGPMARTLDRIDTPPGALPAQILGEVGEAGVTLAKVELDTCGAWVTVANADTPRPLVVRRAEWVDVRGHPFEAATALADDRIGLGPGDALVLARPDGHGDTSRDEFLDCLLSAKPEVDDLRAAAVAGCGGLEISTM